MSYCINSECRKPYNPSDNRFCQSCGAKLLLGDRYRTIKPIGQGGFGKTFLAVDEYKPSRPRCVIKQFFPQNSANAEKAAELFGREAIRLDELGQHPQIPELMAHFQQGEQQYLIQEFIDGQNLEQELVVNGVFTENQIQELLWDLLPVLEFVHERQVIHRDIKPENIIRRNSITLPDGGGEIKGQLVLVDFGASKVITESSLGQTGTMIGSAGYVAPEQLAGKA
ncbi:MAG: protein kinase, partial [Okeania sp. SIO2D1]|nr:protein kinase [Okeania sp. SIO2D1]